jgi:high-affinity nickel-transport protein
MIGLYGWAFVKPIRKLYYNLTITAISVLVAMLVGGIEALGLIGDHFGLANQSAFWTGIGALNDQFGTLGYLIVALFVLVWFASVWIYRVNRYGHFTTSNTT